MANKQASLAGIISSLSEARLLRGRLPFSSPVWFPAALTAVGDNFSRCCPTLKS